MLETLKRQSLFKESETALRTRKYQPLDFQINGLEAIEDLTFDFAADNREAIRLKYLCVVINAVKCWCYLKKMIKSTK